MSSSQSATPPTIPGSLNVDTLQVNKVLKIVDLVVGDALSSLNSWKGAVDAATTANITLSGEQTVDGVALVAGDKVLVKDQATGSENGLYIVQELDWYRSDDMVDGSSAAGSAVFVKDGTANDDQIYVCTNAAGSDVVGTDALVFASLTATIAAAGTATGAVQYRTAGGTLGGDDDFVTDGSGGVDLVSVTASTGDVTATAGDVVATAGNITATAGAVSAGTSVTGATVVATDGATNVLTMNSVTPALTVTDGVDTSTVSHTTVTSNTLTDGTASLTTGVLTGLTSTTTGALISSGQTDLATGGTVGFFGTTAAAQHSSTGDVTGFAANTSGIVDGTAVVVGASGATAYTMGDIVTALKAYGLLAP